MKKQLQLDLNHSILTVSIEVWDLIFTFLFAIL